jgi:hypothetical protein
MKPRGVDAEASRQHLQNAGAHEATRSNAALKEYALAIEHDPHNEAAWAGLERILTRKRDLAKCAAMTARLELGGGYALIV